jgi:hypothetical protein
MKFVTHNGKPTVTEKSQTVELFKDTNKGVFEAFGKNIHHPLEPRGRLGFLIGENIIDLQLASLKYYMNQDDKNIKTLT